MLLLVVAGCGAGNKPVGPAPSGPDNDLATIELRHRPSADDSTLAKISSILDDLQEVCTGNTRVQLADAVTHVVGTLGEKDVRVTPTQVLEAARTGSEVFGPYPVDECRPMFGVLIQLYKRGELSTDPVA